ncbi:periplasmic heavy metal sensor [candidate division KSB1 bacterium]|nr:periplasmic heavy metal sensor [candidate division KSB1 bacterium]MBL7093603.1 periplasmic heavy metal sensor [candidate division KSB1 bacterium]
MSKKILSWLLIISLVINISTIGTFSYYQWLKPEKKNRSERYRRHRESLQKKLGLTDEQSEKMAKLRKNLFEEIKPLINEVKKNRSEVIELIKQDSISIEQINGKIDRINDIEKKIHKKATANLVNYRTILTEEQRNKFIEMVAGRMFGSDYRKSRHSRSQKQKSNSEIKNNK